MDDVIKAREAYFKALGNEGPHPFGVRDANMAVALNAAAAAGQPIPADFDWYADVPLKGCSRLGRVHSDV